MSLFDETLEDIQRNKERKESGDFNCIPFGFPRFDEYIPGVTQESYLTVTANSGVGKSKFTKRTFLTSPYEFIKSNDTDIDLKIFYFSLEESARSLMTSLMSYKLYRDYGISVSKNQIRSIGKGNLIEDETIEKIKEVRKYFEELEDKLEVIDDNSTTPYSIYKTLRDYHYANGEVTYKTKEQVDDKGQKKTKKIPIDYKPYNPNEYVFCIVDHISLIQPEKEDLNLHAAIDKLSSKYFVNLRNRFGTTIVNVQQQASHSESNIYTNKGEQVEEKLVPTLSDLGDNKKTQRDADIVLGLFAPNRHDIAEHAGYDITRLKDNYRSLSILKNRDGESDKQVGLYFDGRTNFFKELPPSNSPEINKAYKMIEKGEVIK